MQGGCPNLFAFPSCCCGWSCHVPGYILSSSLLFLTLLPLLFSHLLPLLYSPILLSPPLLFSLRCFLPLLPTPLLALSVILEPIISCMWFHFFPHHWSNVMSSGDNRTWIPRLILLEYILNKTKLSSLWIGSTEINSSETELYCLRSKRCYS